MSIDAIRWALSVQMKPATAKFVLVAMADRANEDHQCYPSIDRLALDTCLDRKTVIRAISQLLADGLIQDTGERKGSTARVRVFQLAGVIGREVIIPKPDRLNDTDIGSIKAPQKRNDPDNGINPILNGNHPENGSLNIPKNGTQNRSGNHQGTTRGRSSPTGSRLSADWALPDEWKKWAQAEGMDNHRIEAEADKFRDHWLSSPGQKGRKQDWFATWRNWIRRALEGGFGSFQQATTEQRVTYLD